MVQFFRHCTFFLFAHFQYSTLRTTFSNLHQLYFSSSPLRSKPTNRSFAAFSSSLAIFFIPFPPPNSSDHLTLTSFVFSNLEPFFSSGFLTDSLLSSSFVCFGGGRAEEVMKCFHFSNGEKRDEDDAGASGVVSKVSRVSWARSLSVASSNFDTRRSEFDSSDCHSSRDLSDSVVFQEFLSQRRANDLRIFSFSELKSATRGFSRALMVGEGGFGCVFRGRVNDEGEDFPNSKLDVAIKQLNRHGFQA